VSETGPLKANEPAEPASTTEQGAPSAGGSRRNADIDVTFLLAGLLAPGALLAPFFFVPRLGDYGGFLPIAYVAHFIGSIVMLVVGRRKGRVRLRSAGIGGLAFYGLIMLMGLLLTGACLIGAGGA
jgi:hypothetical protein